MDFKDRLTVLIAVVWLVAGTAIMLTFVGSRWDSEELATLLAFAVVPPLVLVGWMWVKRGRDS